MPTVFYLTKVLTGFRILQRLKLELKQCWVLVHLTFLFFRLRLITIGSTPSKTLITMISDIRRVDMGTPPLANITCLCQTGAFKQWHTWRMKMVTDPLLHTKDSLHILPETRCLGHCVHSIVWHSRNDATAIIYWSQMMLECMIKVRMCSCPFWKWGIKGK